MATEYQPIKINDFELLSDRKKCLVDPCISYETHDLLINCPNYYSNPDNVQKRR